MTQKNPSDTRTVLRLRISTILTSILLIGGGILALLGFSLAGDSRVAPVRISIYLFIAAVLFAVQFVYGIRRKERWQRVAAIIAVFAAVFTAAMAIAFYQVLSQVKMPF